MNKTEILALIAAHKNFDNININDFGRIISFTYHRQPERMLHAVVENVYAKYIQAQCLNWHSDTDTEPFERPFYLDHIIGNITDCNTGETLSPRMFYEQYVTTHHPDRKFGNNLAGGDDSQDQICFTGFAAKRKTELKTLAYNTNMWVTDEVRQNLKYLVCGKTAGPKKIEKAQSLGALILTEEDFLKLLDNQ